jgi:hypothetical protein
VQRPDWAIRFTLPPGVTLQPTGAARCLAYLAAITAVAAAFVMIRLYGWRSMLAEPHQLQPLVGVSGLDWWGYGLSRTAIFTAVLGLWIIKRERPPA